MNAPVKKNNPFPRAAALDYLAIHGATSTVGLHAAMGRVTSLKTVYINMHKLLALNLVDRAGGGTGHDVLWSVVAGATAALTKQEPPPPPPLFDPHCLQGAGESRRFDALGAHIPFAGMPVMTCARAGGQNFLTVPSLVSGERRAHQPGYVAVLASKRNHATSSQ